MEWSRKNLILLALNSLKGYVQGNIAKPCETTEPHAHNNWLANDDLAFNFVLENIDEWEQEFIMDAGETTAKGCWDALKK